jgi:uroporphyrinogen decarboxylase
VPDRIPTQFDLCKSSIEHYSRQLGIDPGFTWSYYEDLSYRISANEIRSARSDVIFIMYSDGAAAGNGVQVDISAVGDLMADVAGELAQGQLDT